MKTALTIWSVLVTLVSTAISPEAKQAEEDQLNMLWHSNGRPYDLMVLLAPLGFAVVIGIVNAVRNRGRVVVPPTPVPEKPVLLSLGECIWALFCFGAFLVLMFTGNILGGFLAVAAIGAFGKKPK